MHRATGCAHSLLRIALFLGLWSSLVEQQAPKGPEEDALESWPMGLELSWPNALRAACAAPVRVGAL
ncbi:hypothetical protein RRF57_011052 [Xylaria bambusicola]|uniref:Uncharacterized protein n=1 Tax=Xylaria bambusicola TaxID=326684 RepID=A0AAN7UM56_9PEZI